MPEILRIARKELEGFFASPVAYLFLGAFLVLNLFVFFWGEAFFARNLADVRPLFDWMPLSLIFLSAALSMRLWSEERRAGTLETLMTLPVSPVQLVLGKFLGALSLMGIALALTLPLPLTVSFLGPLDWGPVLGGYLASFLLAAAYLAIGLFVSARTDNPIVSLMGTTLFCGFFYFLGSPVLTGLFSYSLGEWLQLLGSGSRFAAITRGILDLRDLYFYLSIVGLFLSLNTYSLVRLRWADANRRMPEQRRWTWITALVAANFLAANLWLQPIAWARWDTTQGRIYTLSESTRHYLAQLQEPLYIRGYFSAQTHPLLAPLVPQLRDLLREYEVAGGDKVRVEFIDPLEDPVQEREAGEKYGIHPVAFQTVNKYQEAVVNAYFHLLIQYGDAYEVLGFRDLIEIKEEPGAKLAVRLRNPEYDLTRTIRKVLYSYRAGGNLFQLLPEPVQFLGYISSDDRLPEPLAKLRQALEKVLAELAEESKGRFQYRIQDPDADGGRLAEEIQKRFGFQPLTLGLLDPRTFYFYMVLQAGEETVPVPLPETLDAAGLKRVIRAGLKRFAPGVLKTVALYTPPNRPGSLRTYEDLKVALGHQARLQETDLSAGSVPEGTDLLLVVDPRDWTEKQVFALDQFLMQGGTVVLAAASFSVDLGGRSLQAHKQPTGLEDWLDHLGLRLAESMVLDPQNTPFPVPVQRQIGGYVVEEIQTLPYPYFPDIREDGMDPQTGIFTNLGQLTLNWVSPLQLDTEKNRDRQIYRLLWSSPDAWTSSSENIQPDLERYGPLGFPIGEHRQRHLLVAAVEGRFDSYFAGKPSPLVQEAAEETEAAEDQAQEADQNAPIAQVVTVSPPSAKVILLGSSSFLTDTAMDLATEVIGTRYTQPLILMQNLMDWALEDRGLLALRGRGRYSRLLRPLDRSEQLFWEFFHYGLAGFGLLLLYGWHRRNRLQQQRRHEAILAGSL